MHRIARRRSRALLAALVATATTLAGLAWAADRAATPDAPPALTQPGSAAAAAAVAPATGPLALRAEPAEQTVAPRTTVRYALRISGRSGAPLRLRLARQTPRGIRVFLRPATPKRDRADVIVHSSELAATTLHRLRITAHQGERTAGVTLRHRVRQPTFSEQPRRGRRSFSISGEPQRAFVPGRRVPIELFFFNPHREPISVRNPIVSIAGVEPRRAGAACSVADFRVARQVPGWRFRVPPRATMRLSRLGFGRRNWPAVEMINRPVNQDGCKGATVRLAYTATGTAIR